MENLIKIASFDALAPAEALLADLELNGIQGQLNDESTQQHWQLWNLDPRAHLQVRVREADFSQADGLLHQWAAQGGPASHAVRCPDCHSFKVEYPQFSRKTLMGALPSALAAVGLVERCFYCESCHFTWSPVPPKPEPELDILNWPKK